MRTRPTLLTLIFFTASIILSGCLDVEQHYTLNPDGSGKVSIDADLTDWTLDASDKDIKEKLRERVKDFIDSTKGIDAWKDVSYTMNEDKVHFQGTAYFPDITKVESKDLGLAKIVITPFPEGRRRSAWTWNRDRTSRRHHHHPRVKAKRLRPIPASSGSASRSTLLGASMG